VHCSASLCVVIRSGALQYVAVRCSALHCVHALQCVAVICSALQCVAVRRMRMYVCHGRVPSRLGEMPGKNSQKSACDYIQYAKITIKMIFENLICSKQYDRHEPNVRTSDINAEKRRNKLKLHYTMCVVAHKPNVRSSDMKIDDQIL